MKRIAIILLAALLPLCADAQLGKQMSKYHKKTGVGVTQLDKSLYGLYQRENLPVEMKEMLQKLDEINILSIDFKACGKEESEKILAAFQHIWGNESKYRLIKSFNDGETEQLIYTRNRDAQITDLVIYCADSEEAEIIELRGDIQTDQLAFLPQALDIPGLALLGSLSPTARKSTYTDMRAGAQDLQNLLSGFFGGFDASFFSDIEKRLKNAFPSGVDSTGNFDPFGMLGSGQMQQIEKYFQSMGNDGDVVSNSIQITEENGKTNLKIDSKNSDITYIIDGVKAPKDKVQMPEKIVNANLIPSREDMKKSYLFVTSGKQLGTFNSYKDGVLTFRYNEQEYKYNLEKAQRPLLVINGRLSGSFSINPSSILQIRPISQVEKEAGYFPNAEVVINTK